MKTPTSAIVLSACLLALVVGIIEGQSYRTVTASRMALDERSLEVHVEFAAGTLRLQPGDGRLLYQGEIYYDEDRFDPDIEYDSRRRTLTFGIGMRDGGISLGRLETPQRLDLALSPQVPTELSVALGAVEAQLELGGMSLITADLDLGAAKTRLSFSEPNRVECRSLELTVAAAEFYAESLGNSLCEYTSFTGGVGDITLDFTGEWSSGETRHAEIELGLGQLTLRLPRQLGVEIEVDRFLASFDRAGFRKRGSRYRSEGYENAAARLLISIRAVLGDIDIEWVGR